MSESFTREQVDKLLNNLRKEKDQEIKELKGQLKETKYNLEERKAKVAELEEVIYRVDVLDSRIRKDYRETLDGLEEALNQRDKEVEEHRDTRREFHKCHRALRETRDWIHSFLGEVMPCYWDNDSE